MTNTEQRVCLTCGLKLQRKRFNGRLEDRAAFQRRKYCGRDCSNARTPAAKEKRIQAAEAEAPVQDAMPPPLPEKPILPLDYMLRVLNCPNTDQDRRDRMAKLAAPYFHAKAGATGKKVDLLQRAGEVAEGRFGARPAPGKVVPIK